MTIHYWTAPETEMLLGLAGDVPRAMIPQLYNCWAYKHGFPSRSANALRQRIEKLHASTRAVGTWLTTGGIAKTLEVSCSTVEGWARYYDDMPRKKYGKKKTRKVSYFSRIELRKWARKHMQLFGGIERSRLVMLFEDERLADEIVEKYPCRPNGLLDKSRTVRCVETGETWPSIRAAALALYVSRESVARSIRTGEPSTLLEMTFETLRGEGPKIAA
jgi:transposase